MNIKPCRGYVLIEEDKDQETTASGFYVPDNAKDKPQKGVVIDVGLPPFNQAGGVIPTEAKKGDKVYYNRWAGSDITEGTKEYKIVKFEDVLGIIT